jgi:hypothetical protein
MSLFSQLGMLGIGLSGILFGVALSYIAPEELQAGKKYFLFLRGIFYVLFTIITTYFIWPVMSLIGILVQVILLSGLILRWKTSALKFEPLIYITFIACFFLVPIANYAPIAATLIFLYGLTVGTLLKIK